MKIQTASMTITTSHLVKARKFYEQHFDAKASFDCGWYVVLRLSDANGSPEICFMEPRDGMSEFTGGATLNLRVADADALYTRLTQNGIKPTIPLEDHPWGDRGFGVLDPCGVVVYCYHDIDPSSEFKQYFIYQD